MSSGVPEFAAARAVIEFGEFDHYKLTISPRNHVCVADRSSIIIGWNEPMPIAQNYHSVPALPFPVHNSPVRRLLAGLPENCRGARVDQH